MYVELVTLAKRLVYTDRHLDYEPKDGKEFELFAKFKDYVVQELPRRLCPRLYLGYDDATEGDQRTLLTTVETVVCNEANEIFRSYLRQIPSISDSQTTKHSERQSQSTRGYRHTLTEQSALASLDQSAILDSALEISLLTRTGSQSAGSLSSRVWPSEELSFPASLFPSFPTQTTNISLADSNDIEQAQITQGENVIDNVQPQTGGHWRSPQLQ